MGLGVAFPSERLEMNDPWREGPEQLSARLLRPMLTLFEERCGREALESLVEELGGSLLLLEDPDRWFSAERFIALNRAMVERSGDPDLPYRAGREIVEPATLGPLRLGLFDLVTSLQAFELLPRVASAVSRISEWAVEPMGKGRARIIFKAQDLSLDDITFCRNRHGSLESLPEIIGRPSCIVTHPECIHRGGTSCVYDAHWTEPPPWTRLAWLGAVLAGGLGVAGAVVGWLVWPILLGTAIALSGFAASRGSEDNRKRQETVWHAQQLVEANERRVRELSATQRVSDAIRGSLDPTALVQRVLDELRASLGYDRALYLGVEEDGRSLVPTGSVGFGDTGAALTDMRIALFPETGGARLFGGIVEGGRPVLISDIDEYSEHLLPANRDRLRAIGTTGFIAAPVSWRGSRHGLLLVDRQGAGRPLDSRDLDVVGSVAGSLGAGLSSAQLYDQAREALLINQKFRHYLPRSVVDDVQADPEAALQLGGDSIHAAIVFCDVADFTARSTRATPAEVIRALNVWFGITDPIIATHRGIIDKRIGDAILIVFLHLDEDAPEAHPVARAIACSEEMQAQLKRRGVEIAEAAVAFAGLQVRQAIHYGEVIAGNLGSVDRMEYTIVGDAVNVCARLERITPAGQVWLTGEALKAMGTHAPERYQEMETLTLRGRTTATSTYRVQTIEE
jgi:adenylate cyclase